MQLIWIQKNIVKEVTRNETNYKGRAER